MPIIEVCLSPALLHCYDISDKTVVVVDVLRATTTMCTALHHGIKNILPVASIDECLSYKSMDNHILAAERDAKTAHGFEYSNSPHDYMPHEASSGAASTKGKTLVLTTTNGTKILNQVLGAREIVIGAFVNVDALANYLMQTDNNILVACAAWKDRVNMEDSIFAGALIHRLHTKFQMACDSGRMMQNVYASCSNNVFEFHKQATHYHRLIGIGAERDLKYCLTENLAPVVPILRGNELLKL